MQFTIVNTLNDLRQLSTSNFSLVHTLGGASVGDGLAQFYFSNLGDARADNGTTIIAPVNGNGRFNALGIAYLSLSGGLSINSAAGVNPNIAVAGFNFQQSRFEHIDPTQTANNRIHSLEFSGGNFYGTFLNDTITLGTGWLQVTGGQAAGIIRIALTGPVVFPSVGTTASAANAFLDNANSNNLLRSTSSLQYKTDLLDLSLDEARKISFGRRSFSYRSTSEADDSNKRWIGYAAEEVAPVDDRFVTSDETGDPNWVQYERFVVPHGLILDDHDSRIVALESKIADLEKKIAALTP